MANNKYADGYVNGDGTNTNQQVSIKATLDEVEIGGGAVMKGSYVTKTIDGSNYWLYSAHAEDFKPSNDDSFNYDTANGGTGSSSSYAGQDLRNTVLPFYYYLEFAAPTSAKRVIIFADGEATGLDNVTLVGSDDTAPVYDLQGRFIGKGTKHLKPGIYIVNGKKLIIK